MQRVREIALIVGLSLLGTFAIVMGVYLLLPMDPLNPEPLINYRAVFAIVFVVMIAALTISHRFGNRADT